MLKIARCAAVFGMALVSCGSSKQPPPGGAHYLHAEWFAETPGTSGASINIGVTQNSLLMVVIAGNGTIGSAAVTDEHNVNTYLVASTSTGGAMEARYFYTINKAFDTINLGVTWPTTLTNVVVVEAEFGNVASASPLDVANSASGNGTSINCGALTTSNANDSILLFAVGAPGTFSLVNQFSMEPFPLNPSPMAPATLQELAVDATGSHSASLTDSASGPWVCFLAAFKNGPG